MAHWFVKGEALCRSMYQGAHVSSIAESPPSDACRVCADLLMPGWRAGKTRNHWSEHGVAICMNIVVRLTVSKSPVKKDCDRCSYSLALRSKRMLQEVKV